MRLVYPILSSAEVNVREPKLKYSFRSDIRELSHYNFSTTHCSKHMKRDESWPRLIHTCTLSEEHVKVMVWTVGCVCVWVGESCDSD